VHVHVDVDAQAMREFLQEWKDRDLTGEPPSGLRIMSQCAAALCAWRWITSVLV
jgi:hypothetical protein